MSSGTSMYIYRMYVYLYNAENIAQKILYMPIA